MDVKTQVHNVAKIISDLLRPGYFGRVVVSIENGKITVIRKEETVKLTGS